MEQKYNLTIAQLRALFIAGCDFERETIEFDMEEIDEVTQPDFGEYIKQTLNINIK